MKTDIHPKYNENIKITCSCGNEVIAGSTAKTLKTEICSACHPFYTGQQKLVDTAGRVDKFMARVKKAQKIKESDVKMVDEELDEIIEHNETEEVPTEAEKQEETKESETVAEVSEDASEVTEDVEENKETEEEKKEEEASATPEKKSAKKTTKKASTKKSK